MRAALALFSALLTVTPSAWSQARRPAPDTSTAARRALPAGLDARLSWSRGDVEVSGAGAARHAPVEGELLTRGARVQVRRGGAAEIALRNGTLLEVGERSQVIMFASPVPDEPHRPQATTTTLRFGTLRVRMAAPSRRAPALLPIATGSAVVFVGRADAEVQALESGRITHLAVHRGRLPVATPRGSFAVRADHGTIQRGGRRSLPEWSLPSAPLWVAPPPERVMSGGEPVDVAAAYGMRRGRPTRWRVEVARDAAFRDVASTDTLSGREVLWEGHGIAPGTYFVRVAALDDDGLAGRPSPVAPLTVAAPRVVQGHGPRGAEPGRRTAVYMPPGFHCSLDGTRLGSADAPLRLAPALQHRLRCAATADGRHAREVTVAASLAGPLLHEVRFHMMTGDDHGVLGFTLRDAVGSPVPYANVTVRGDGVAVDPVREADERGVYNTVVRWPRGLRRARLRFTVNDAETFEEDVARPD